MFQNSAVMYTGTCSLMFLLVTQNIRADVSVTDYVYWSKADISAWHQYFPSRMLEQERLTIHAAIETVAILVDEIGTSLAATVRYQEQELETAQFSMEGTSAQGCIGGISPYMEKAVNEGVESFQDCVADVPSNLNRLYTTWSKINVSYNTAYQRALEGIDNCARTYPNRGSSSRLKTCVEAWTNIYFTSAKSTDFRGMSMDMSGSPAMRAFSDTVGHCAQSAMSGVVAKGQKFLGMLVQCAKLSENMDSVMYEQELTSEFEEYVTSNDLTYQFWSAAFENYYMIYKIELQLIDYYELQKKALEKYVIESRGQSYYYGRMVRYLQKYLDTVSSTSVDNPANADCVSEANYVLNDVLNTGALKALECDAQIVNNTKFLIARVNNYFSKINNILPYTGNVAFLSCLSKGYIFAEHTILDCYSLALNDFKINITELNATIVDDVQVLLGYETSFFSNSSLPCGDSILSRAFLEADRTLYNLQRCLYVSMGTKYAVTTAAPYTAAATTTVAPTTPTTTTQTAISTPNTPTAFTTTTRTTIYTPSTGTTTTTEDPPSTYYYYN